MNLESLLQPIAPDAPCGEDLSYSLEFDAIVEQRREDDPTLDQGDWVRPLKLADWPGVIARCEGLLIERTKDLRVAGWLTDAQARVRGFAGLADGLELCGRLCDGHWNGLHPRPDDDGDLGQRAGAIAWLLGQVPVLVRSALAGGAVVVSGDATPPATDVLVASLADIRRAVEALDGLQRAVDPRLGAEGPGFGAARRALDEVLARAERPGRVAGGVAGGADAPNVDALPTSASSPSSVDAPVGPLRTRAQALRQLREVADFFRRTEPHSPVAYLADKAAAWGDMPLHAWLRTVLKDPGALAHVEELLGVMPPDIVL